MPLNRRAFFVGLLATPIAAKILPFMPAAVQRKVGLYLELSEVTRKAFAHRLFSEMYQYHDLFSAPNVKIASQLRIRLPSAEWSKFDAA